MKVDGWDIGLLLLLYRECLWAEAGVGKDRCGWKELVTEELVRQAQSPIVSDYLAAVQA